MQIRASVAEAAETVQQTPLEELGPVLSALMKRVTEYRDGHAGFVPPELFPLILGISGQYTCLEIIPRIVDSHHVVGYLLRQRGSGEQGWQGEFNIPGVAITAIPDGDMLMTAQLRLEQEIDFISSDEWDSRRHNVTPLGVEAHSEAERNTTCITIIRALDISIDEFRALENTLSEKWKFFPAALTDGSEIVNHHQRTLAWINSPSRESFEFVDLRRER